jgi:hypothetical protein
MVRLPNPGQRRLLKRLLVVGAVIVGATVFPSSAAAVAPVTTTGTLVSVSDLTGVCAFTVKVTSTITYREMDFYDQNGRQTASLIHVDEQDVFSANGKTLQGLPFTFELQFLVDSSGNFTHIFSNGVVERVPLPDGSLFLSAGRVDFLAHPGATFLLTPDVGNSGNVGAFCAALSP